MTNPTQTLIKTVMKESMQTSQAERDKQTAAILEAELEAERQYWKALEPFTEEYEIMTDLGDLSAEDLTLIKLNNISNYDIGFMLDKLQLYWSHNITTLSEAESRLIHGADTCCDDETAMKYCLVLQIHILLKMGLIAVSKDGQFWLTEKGQSFLNCYKVMHS